MTDLPVRTQRNRLASEPGGFTLLELLVVMSLVGVMMGIGIGFLQRHGTDMDLALSILRDQVRIAELTARTRHLPTEVVVQPASQERAARLRARVLAPVGHWHLEERERWQGGTEAIVTGQIEPGRFGMARRPDLDSQEALLSLAVGKSARFDLREGFALRVDLLLSERQAMVIARFGGGFEVGLDSELVPTVKMVGTEGGGKSGPAVELHGTEPVRLHRWLTLEVVYDRRRIALLVDGKTLDSAAMKLPLWQREQDVMQISPGDQPVHGLVDEVQLLAYEFSLSQELPVGIELEVTPPSIEFDRLAALQRPVKIVLSSGEDRRELRVGPGGLIQ